MSVFRIFEPTAVNDPHALDATGRSFSPGKTRGIGGVLVLAGAAAALVVFGALLQPVVVDGETRLSMFGVTIPTTCWFKLTTGIPCAGCGLTRSIVLLIHGRPADAFVMHPFGPWIVALGLLAAPPLLGRSGNERPRRWVHRWNRGWVFLAAATLLSMTLWWVHHVGLVRILSALLT